MAAIAIKPGFIRLINTDTLEEYATFPAGDPHGFSADGNHLVAVDENLVVQVWNLAGLRQRLESLGLDWQDPNLDYAQSAGYLTEASCNHGLASMRTWQHLFGRLSALL